MKCLAHGQNLFSDFCAHSGPMDGNYVTYHPPWMFRLFSAEFYLRVTKHVFPRAGVGSLFCPMPWMQILRGV